MGYTEAHGDTMCSRAVRDDGVVLLDSRCERCQTEAQQHEDRDESYGWYGGEQPARTAYAGSYVLRGIPPELHRAAKIRAAERGESLRAALLRLLRQYAEEGR